MYPKCSAGMIRTSQTKPLGRKKNEGPAGLLQKGVPSRNLKPVSLAICPWIQKLSNGSLPLVLFRPRHSDPVVFFKGENPAFGKICFGLLDSIVNTAVDILKVAFVCCCLCFGIVQLHSLLLCRIRRRARRGYIKFYTNDIFVVFSAPLGPKVNRAMPPFLLLVSHITTPFGDGSYCTFGANVLDFIVYLNMNLVGGSIGNRWKVELSSRVCGQQFGSRVGRTASKDPHMPCYPSFPESQSVDLGNHFGPTSRSYPLLVKASF